MDHKPTYEELLQRVTELESLETPLRNSSRLNNQIIEHSQDGIIVYGLDLRYQQWNPAMEKLTGKTSDEVIGKHPLEIFPFLKEVGVIERIERVLRGESVSVIDFPFYIPQSKKRGWASDMCSPLKNDKGEITGVIGIVRDVTERKKYEETVRKTQIFNETILSASPDVIYIYDIIQRKNIYSNDGINKVLGYTIYEIKEMGENLIQTLMHPDDFSSYFEDVLPRYKIIKDNEVIEHEYRMKHKSGQWCWLRSKESIFSRQEDGTPVEIFGIISNITKQKRDEERILKSEKEYHSLFNKMLDGFALHEIICDEEGKPVNYRFLKVNPAFEKLTGLKKENLIGKTILDILPNTEKEWIDIYGKVALTGKPVLFENYAEGLGKHFEVTAYSPAKNQFACIFQDITSRKTAEEEKRALEIKLRQSHKLEAIGTLAGGIAHDFNNILAGIIGYADLAQDEIPDGSPAKPNIASVLKAANRAKDLVKQILAFSRKSEQNREIVLIQQLVKEIYNFLRATIPATIDIQLDFPTLCGNIFADSTQIHQVLMNICANAVHAMEDNGGVLRIGTNDVELTADDLKITPDLKPGSYILLYVEDTGVGIEKENIERIFDPYFTTKEVGKGSGIGLAVVHGIVKSHEGLITVESSVGQGTKFNLFFPKNMNEVVDEVTDNSPLSGGNEKILLVDDDASIVRFTHHRLEKLGYQVTSETSSMELLKLFRAAPNSYDLVITDQTMPNMTGDTLAKELLNIRSDIPIIMCTGYSSKIDIEKARIIGISAFMMKPFDKRELAKTIRKVLDKKKF